MEATFDDLTRAVAQPRSNVCAVGRAIALNLAGKLLMGIAIGLGIAIGMAIAG